MGKVQGAGDTGPALQAHFPKLLFYRFDVGFPYLVRPPVFQQVDYAQPMRLHISGQRLEFLFCFRREDDSPCSHAGEYIEFSIKMFADTYETVIKTYETVTKRQKNLRNCDYVCFFPFKIKRVCP